MTLNQRRVVRTFKGMGGRFLIPPAAFIGRARSVRAFLFDWDGVFNDGSKNAEGKSGYSEPDAMGLNLLRYGYYRLHGTMPIMGIITGESNPAARNFAQRMKFDAYYEGIREKTWAFGQLLEESELKSSDIAWVFDDVNDCGIADICRLRILISRASSPLTAAYADENDYSDFCTAGTGGSGALREMSELILGLLGLYEEVVNSRIKMDDKYREFWGKRPLTPYIGNTQNDKHLSENS